jgi:hypothetical protein
VRSALLVVIVAVSACSGGTSDGHEISLTSHLDLPDLSNRSVDVTTPISVDPPHDGSAAASPSDAVLRFVQAEVGGDTDASYDLLSEADRNAVRSRINWQRMHSALPALVTFTARPKQAEPSGADATIIGDATFTPRLDEIGGLVAGRATVAWTVVSEQGGWRVAYQRTSIQPVYAADSGATESARAWLAALQSCAKPDPALEYAGGIVGSVGVAGALCNSAAAKLDAPKRLGDRPDPAPVLAAFGPEADTWARIIRVTGPRTFNIVLAPLADRWIVIGVLADGP